MSESEVVELYPEDAQWGLFMTTDYGEPSPDYLIGLYATREEAWEGLREEWKSAHDGCDVWVAVFVAWVHPSLARRARKSWERGDGVPCFDYPQRFMWRPVKQSQWPGGEPPPVGSAEDCG